MKKTQIILISLLGMAQLGPSVNASYFTGGIDDEKFGHYQSRFIGNGHGEKAPIKLQEAKLSARGLTIKAETPDTLGNRNNLLVLKMHGDRCAFNFISKINFAESHEPVLAQLRAGKQHDLKMGFTAEECDRLYSSNPIDIIFPRKGSFGLLLVDTNGDISIKAKELNLNTFFAPRGSVTIISGKEKCPIQSICVTPADKDYPMLIYGRALFSGKKPIVEFEMLNVGSMVLSSDFSKYALTRRKVNVMSEEEYTILAQGFKDSQKAFEEHLSGRSNVDPLEEESNGQRVINFPEKE